jgi:hypothetical protein
MHAAVVAGLAAAAVPWSTPQTLSKPHEFVNPVGIGFASDGSALADWTFQDGTDRSATTGAAGATRPQSAAEFGAEHPLVAPRRINRPTELVGQAPLPGGRSVRVTIAHRHLNPLRSDACVLRANGRAIAIGPQMLRATLASDAGGDVAVAWWERAKRSRLWVAVMRHDRRFGTPQLLTEHGFGDVAIAVGPRGDVLATWQSGGVIRAVTRTPHARRFGAPVVVHRGAPSADLEAGLARTGRAIVAWGAQFRDEGGAGQVTDAAAIRAPGARRFRVKVLERDPKTVIAQPVHLAVEPSGRATFAWTGWDGTNYRVRAAVAAPSGAFGAPQTMSVAGQDAVLGGVAAHAGRSALAWTASTPGSDGAIEAAVSGAAGAFAAPEVVSPGPRANFPAIAYDTRTGRPTVVWSERAGPGGGGVPQTVARAATRGAG